MKKDLCIEFDLKALPSFLFHLKWPIFTYYKNDNASRLRRSYKNNFQTRHSRPISIPHSSLMASPLVTRGESKWAFVTRWELFFPFTCGKPLVKGKIHCLHLSLNASRHSITAKKRHWIFPHVILIS